MTALSHCSRSDPLLACAGCGESYRADIWLVVDVAERPDLAAKICQGTLHTGICPQCGEAQVVDMGLLVFRPYGNPALLFSPAQATTPEEDQDQARGLLNLLYQTMPDEWQDEWLLGFGPLPRETLVEMLAGEADERGFLRPF
ncbi:MAG: CpXC domain-containing protein [Chloroflexota bacterium]